MFRDAEDVIQQLQPQLLSTTYCAQNNTLRAKQHIARYAGDVIDDNGDNLRSNQLPRALKEIYILLLPYVRFAHMIIIVQSLLSKQTL